MLLAVSDFSNPLLWAVVIGWIFTVVLHEFAHGLVGHLGGDYTLRERGGLTLNPLQYIDPVFSILLPIVFLLMGGVPLPGGVTFVRRDLLRSRLWDSAVSLAGPVMNFLLFLALSLPFHPKIGWLRPGPDPADWSNPQMFMGCLAILQVVAVVINLIPIPPLDGFGVIGPFMSPDLRTRLSTPPTSTIAFLMLFFIIWQVPGFMQVIYQWTMSLLRGLGFDDTTVRFMASAFNTCLYGRAG